MKNPFSSLRSLVLAMVGMALSLLPSVVQAQEADVPESKIPAAVLENYKKLFPKAETAEWDKFPEFYEVDFTENGVDKEAIFSLTGEWLITERTLPFHKLPQAVKDALAKSEYASYKVREAAEVEMPGVKDAFGVDVVKGKEEKAVYFDPTGKIIKVTED